jgi:hypothetical protein
MGLKYFWTSCPCGISVLTSMDGGNAIGLYGTILAMHVTRINITRVINWR